MAPRKKDKKYHSSASVITKSRDKNKKKPSKISDAQREKIRRLKRESDGLDYLKFLSTSSSWDILYRKQQY